MSAQNLQIQGSLLAMPVNSQNFSPQNNVIVTTGASTASKTFTPLTGTQRQSFIMSNLGSHTAWVGWGVGSATATANGGTVAAASAGFPIPAGITMMLDLQLSAGGIVDTVAYIEDAGGTTSLSITIGSGS